MKVLLLGATGPCGIEIAKKVMAQGHILTALARDPSKITVTGDLHVVKGDILDKEVIPGLLQGQDAVVSSLGVGKSFKSNNLMARAYANLLPEMQRNNIKRLISVSAFGVGDSFKQANAIQRFFYRLLLRNIYADKEKADQMIRSSGLDWTIIYPVMFTNKPFSGVYKTGDQLPMKGMPKLRRADLADFIAKQLTDPSNIHKSPVIMN